MEIWKDIEGYEGLYQVSNLGRVRGLPRLVKHYLGGVNSLKGKLKKPSNLKGYLTVGLCKDGLPKSHKVHRLVAMAFIPNHLNKSEVNHISGLKSDNRVENLEWCTSAENTKHSYKIGLHKGSHYGLFGAKNPCSKPVIQIDKQGRRIAEYDSLSTAGRVTGIHSQSICHACKGIYKMAGGFIWKYKEVRDENV